MRQLRTLFTKMCGGDLFFPLLWYVIWLILWTVRLVTEKSFCMDGSTSHLGWQNVHLCYQLNFCLNINFDYIPGCPFIPLENSVEYRETKVQETVGSCMAEVRRELYVRVDKMEKEGVWRRTYQMIQETVRKIQSSKRTKLEQGRWKEKF